PPATRLLPAACNGCDIRGYASNRRRAMVEGLRLAVAGGLDPETTLRVVSGGAAGSRMLANLDSKILAGDFAPGFRIHLQQKDLRLASEWIYELGIDCPGTGLTHSLFTQAFEKGLGRQSTHGLINLQDERRRD